MAPRNDPKAIDTTGVRSSRSYFLGLLCPGCGTDWVHFPQADILIILLSASHNFRAFSCLSVFYRQICVYAPYFDSLERI